MNFQKLREERIPKVVHHRLACGGEARLAGSRVCVWNIIWNLNNGRTEEELLEDFPRLTLADIKAAKKYYCENKQEIDYDIYNHSRDFRSLGDFGSLDRWPNEYNKTAIIEKRRGQTACSGKFDRKNCPSCADDN